MNGIHNRIFTLLLILSTCIWSYNSWIIVKNLSVQNKNPVIPVTTKTHALSLESQDQNVIQVSFNGKFRDPFKPDIGVQPTGSRPNRRESATKETAPETLPDITLLGILWSTASPIATLQSAKGKVMNLREGMIISNATVVDIQKDKVRLKMGNRMFDLRLSDATLMP